MEDSKKCRKYKAGDKYWPLCLEEKIAIVSYNNPNELLTQRPEILNASKHKKTWLLGKYKLA